MNIYTLEAFIDDNWMIVRVSSWIDDIEDSFTWETNRYKSRMKFRIMSYRVNDLSFIRIYARNTQVLDAN